MEAQMFSTIKFGAYLSRLRKQSDQTQSELADKLNLTRQAVSKYERGDSFPDISILLLIAETFGVSVESLVMAGEPTQKESQLLLHQSATGITNVDEIMNIAPLLKPSVLDKIVLPLKKQGIDISHIVELSEYMSANSLETLMDGTDLSETDPELLRRLIPVLNDDSKLNIFERILDGKMDWRFIRTLVPYMEYIRPVVEAAILDGALPHDVLEVGDEPNDY
jgi:transcriptional regulator with XRE-family HTH domain